MDWPKWRGARAHHPARRGRWLRHRIHSTAAHSHRRRSWRRDARRTSEDGGERLTRSRSASRRARAGTPNDQERDTMMQASELFTLARDLAHLKVLSVYIDNRVVDPAKRHAWRADLASRLRH